MKTKQYNFKKLTTGLLTFFSLLLLTSVFGKTIPAGTSTSISSSTLETETYTLPDLSIPRFNPFLSSERGKLNTFNFEIKNENMPLEGFFTVTAWLSEDEVVQRNTDILVEYIVYNAIGVETLPFAKGAYVIPEDYPLGMTNIILKVDGYDNQTESDEENNTFVRSLEILENSGAPCTNKFANGTLDCSEYLPDGNLRIVTNENDILTETIFNPAGGIVSTESLGLAFESILEVENNILIRTDATGNTIETIPLSVAFQNYVDLEQVIEYEDGYIFAAYLPYTDFADKTLVLIKTNFTTNILSTRSFSSPGGFIDNLSVMNEERFALVYNISTFNQGSNQSKLLIFDTDLAERWLTIISNVGPQPSVAGRSEFRKTACGTFTYKNFGGFGSGGGGFSFTSSTSESYHVFEGDTLRRIKTYSTGSTNAGAGGNQWVTTNVSFSGAAADGGILSAKESFYISNLFPPFFNYIASSDTVFFKKEMNGAEVWSSFKTPFSVYPFMELVELDGKYYLLNEDTDLNQVTLTQVECNNNGRGEGPLPDLVITAVDFPTPVINGTDSEVTITVENQGLGYFRDSYIDIRILVNSSQSQFLGYSNLADSLVIAPGESFTFTDNFNNLGGPIGENIIGFDVNLFEYFEESNYRNNNFSKLAEFVAFEPETIDLELSLVQADDTPDRYSDYPVVATISNTGLETATDIVIDFSKPEGVVYVGSNPFSLSQGNFSPHGSQLWFVGDLAPGTSANLSVNYFLLAETAPLAYAQVQSVNEEDLDSTPNNGTPPTPNEDDEANTSGGTNPPVLKPDLELSMRTIANVNFASSRLQVELILENKGNGIATEVDVQLDGLGGAVYTGFDHQISQGVYDDENFLWEVGNIAADESARLVLELAISALRAEDYKIFAEVINQNEVDQDSEAGNGNGETAVEDDEAITPNRACEIEAIINIVSCDPVPADQSPALDEFMLEVEVSNAPEGWNLVFGLYEPPNNSGDGNGTFLVGPVYRYELESGFYIFDRGIPFCSYSTTVDSNAPCSTGEGVDLELILDQQTQNPAQWSNYATQAIISNTGTETATDIIIDFPKANGIVYVGGDEYSLSKGTFNPYGNQYWNIAELPPGETAILEVNYFLVESSAPISYAQVLAMNEADADSSPGNGTPPTPNEDDEASTATGGASGQSFMAARELATGMPTQIVSIRPNPIYFGTAKVTLYSKETKTYQLQCYNTLAKLEKIFTINLQAGWNTVDLDVTNLPAGSYYLHLPEGHRRQSPTKFVVVRD